MQVAKSSTIPSASDVIDLCWVLYNKPRIVATFFFQRTTAFELFLFRTFTSDCLFYENKRKTVREIRQKIANNKCVAARRIWQLVIHCCVIELFWKKSSYVSGVSVCVFVALWICGFVCSDVCCRGQQGWRYYELMFRNQRDLASKHDIAPLKVKQGHFETAILVLHNFVVLYYD